MNFSSMTKRAWPLLTAALLVGCSAQSLPKITKEEPLKNTQEGVNRDAQVKTTPAEQNPDQRQIGEKHTPQHTVRAPRIGATDGQQYGDKSLNEQADAIADTVKRIPGVERSAVLLTGKTALIGVDLGKDISGSKIDTIKYAAKEAAEGTGKGYNAVVTADVDTVQRGRDLMAGLQAGKPISTIGDEIADILSRLIPEM